MKFLKEYWLKFADKTLDFLKNRPVSVEQIFGGKVVFRRHPLKQKDQLIYVNSVNDILYWAHLHTYSFHPYICYTDQKAPCWYVLDIDPGQNVDFIDVKYVTYDIIKLLKDVDFLKRIKFDDKLDLNSLKLAFCGKNGFHIFIDFKIKNQEEVFKYSKLLSLEIAKKLNPKYLQQDILLDLTSKEEQLALNRDFDKALIDKLKHKQRFINLDTRINHRFANIRSPYSIHPETNRVSVLLTVDKLLDFDIRTADIKNFINIVV